MSGGDRILVLGIGNVLLADEGVGVRVVELLEERYVWPEGVTLMDGGATGMALLQYIEECDRLVVVDAVNGGEAPGTVYRFGLDEFQLKIPKKLSAHDVGFLECLTICELNGRMPREVRIVGVQPFDITLWQMELTPAMALRIDEVAGAVLAELATWGILPQESETTER